jgi:hypothetical protein
MVYTDFKSVLNRDNDKAAYFLQPDSAASWLNAINDFIADWIIAQNDQSLWEVVRFVSVRRGIIKMKLSREKFARMICTFCGEKLKEGKTWKNLKDSMDQCKWINDIKKYEKLPECHELRKLVSQIEKYFDDAEAVTQATPNIPTILDRLETYLRSIADNQSNRFPCSKVVVRPDYGDDIMPDIAVEQYKKKAHLNLKTPSSIEAYEIISGSLTIEKLRAFLGQYEGRRNIKLFIVSTQGITNDVYSLAEKKWIGYVRINPQKEMTTESYILPRSVEDYSTAIHNTDMLFGRISMDVPMVIWNGAMTTTSLADALKYDNITINPTHELRAPYLTNNNIDSIANEVTQEYVERGKFLLANFDKDNLFMEKPRFVRKRDNGYPYVEKMMDRVYLLDLSIDPFILAEAQGLRHITADLPAGQLGRLDLLSETVIIDRSGLNNYDRYRFTMAHELGHYMLHASLIKEQGIASFGETEKTINDDLFINTEDMKRFERQANRFAATLLMPEEIVKLLYYYLYTYHYTGQVSWIFYSQKQPETWDSYRNIVGGIHHILNVSIKAAELRLEDLNLLKIG